MIIVEIFKRKLIRGFNLVLVLSSKGGWIAFRKWKPFSVSCFRICKRLKDIDIPFKTIVDGGANIGQFARAASETFPQAQIYSFEPLPETYQILRKNLKDNSRVVFFNAALGNKDGVTNINQNLHVHSSSILSLHPEHNKIFPDTQNRRVASLKVKLMKLDSALKGKNIEKPFLLKLDVQGYELEALRGAKMILRQTTAILLETTFTTLYKNEPSFSRIEDFLKGHGFRFQKPLDILEDSRGRIVQMDALFLKNK